MVGPGSGQVAASGARGRSPAPQRRSIIIHVPGLTRGWQGIRKHLERTDSSGGTNIGASTTLPVMVPLDREDHADTDYYYAMASSTDQVQVVKAGRYRVTYGVSGDTDSTSATTTQVALYRNGTTTLQRVDRGQRYIYTRHSDRPEGSAQATVILDLAADDILRVGGLQVGGSGGECDLIANGSSILVELIEDQEWAYPGGRHVAPFAGLIESVIVAKGGAGSSGDTEVDVLIDDVSITGSLGLVLSYADVWQQFFMPALDTTRFDAGAVFSLGFPASNDEDPPAEQVTVQIICQVAG